MKPKVREFVSYASYKHGQEGSCGMTRLFPVYQKRFREDYEDMKAFLPRKGRVLDAGCGDGYTMDLMENDKFRCVGVDFCEEKLIVAVEHGRAILSCDLAKMPWDDEEFDAVYCRHTLEHLIEPQKVLKEFHRVLADGGRLSLMVPIGAPQTKHVHEIPSLEYVSGLVVEAGFTVLRAHEFSAQEKGRKHPEAWIWAIK